MNQLGRSRWVAWALASAAVCAWATVAFQFCWSVGGSAPVTWWVARGSGLIAYVAMSGSMLLGLMVSWRGLAGALDQKRVFTLHDFLALLTLFATVVHILAVVIIAVVGPEEFMVVAPIPATFGVLATVGVVLVFASRWITSRVPLARWRLLHRAAFIVFVVAVAHAMTAAPGVIESPVRWLYALLGSIVGGATLFRVMFRHLGGAQVAEPVSLSSDPAVAAGLGWSQDTFVAELDRLVADAATTGQQLLLVYVDCSAAAGLDNDPVDWAERAGGAVATAVKQRDLVTRLGDDGLAVIRRGRAVSSQRDALRETVREAVLLHAAEGEEPLVGVAGYPTDAWQGEGLLRAAIMSMYERQLAHFDSIRPVA